VSNTPAQGAAVAAGGTLSGFRGCLVKRDRSENVPKRGYFFDRLRRIAGLFNEKDRKKDHFGAFTADSSFARQPLRQLEEIDLPELRRIGLRLQGVPRGAYWPYVTLGTTQKTES
jgi:hypothetical protein